MADLRWKQGEAKAITFTVTDSSGTSAANLAGSTLTFKVKASHATTVYSVIMASDTNFSRTSEAYGIVTLALAASQTTQAAGSHIGELKIQWSTSNIDKSKDISIIVDKAVI